MNLQLILFALSFIGFLLIVIYFTKIFTYSKCPRDKIVYRFLPRSLADQMLIPIPIDDIFGDMFTKSSPWVGSLNVYDISARKKMRGTDELIDNDNMVDGQRFVTQG
jgi:hypothetical protein